MMIISINEKYIVTIYKPPAVITLNHKIGNACLLSLFVRQRCPSSPFIPNLELGILEQWARNGKKTNIRKKEFKLFILMDMVVSTEKPKGSKKRRRI